MPAADVAVHSNQTARTSSPWGFPVREDIAFTDAQGGEQRGLAKRTLEVLEKLHAPLRKILAPDEVVLYVARGQTMPSKAERYLLGVQSHYLSQSLLVLTNRRLLDFALKRTGEWDRGARGARWGDVKSARLAGLLYGKLHLEYRQGTRDTYWRLRKDAAKKVKMLLDVLLPAAAEEALPELAMTSYCPACFAALTPGVYVCSGCGQKFKNAKTALLHALVIPGGGYFYVNLHLWGIAHAFVDLSLFVSVLLWVLAALGIVPPQPTPGITPGKLACAFLAAIPGAMLALEIWLALRVARRKIHRFMPE